MTQTPYFQGIYKPYPTGFLYGLMPAWSTNTALTVSAGNCRDVSDKDNIVLASPVTINAAVNGANGLDTGALANSTWYYVYVIGDSSGKNAAAGLVSTNATQPIMPSGYDMVRLVGYWVTDGSAHFWLAYVVGSGGARKFQYDIVQLVLSGGVATGFTQVSLASFVPPLTNVEVDFKTTYIPATAGNRVTLRTGGSSASNPITLSAIVATQIQDAFVSLMTGIESSNPSIDYKVASASDSISLYVWAFRFYV